MRLKFLHSLNGVSLFYDTMLTHSNDMELYTDASLIGIGWLFKN